MSLVAVCNSCSSRVSPLEKRHCCVVTSCGAPICEFCFRKSSMCEMCKYTYNGLATRTNNGAREAHKSSLSNVESNRQMSHKDAAVSRSPRNLRAAAERKTPTTRESFIPDYFFNKKK